MKVVHSLKRATLEFDANKPPQVQTLTTADGSQVKYMDVPGIGFYAGTHKGFTYTPEHMQQLEDSFRAPTDDLFGPVPLMMDHSYSNHDKIGHIRSVNTVGSTSHIVARLIGEKPIQDYREGKIRTLSAGIMHFCHSDGDGDEPAEMAETIECPECGFENAEDADECENCGEPLTSSRQFSSAWLKNYGDGTQKVRVAYDHVAATPFPALTACKLHKRSTKTVSKNPENKQETVSMQEFADLKARAERLESEKAAAEAAREAAEREKDAEKARAERKLAAFKRTKELIATGKLTPAQEEDFAALLATLNEAQAALFDALMEKQPVHPLMTESKGVQAAVKPEDQNPLGQVATLSKEQIDAEAAKLLGYCRNHHQAGK